MLAVRASHRKGPVDVKVHSTARIARSNSSRVPSLGANISQVRGEKHIAVYINRFSQTKHNQGVSVYLWWIVVGVMVGGEGELNILKIESAERKITYITLKLAYHHT